MGALPEHVMIDGGRLRQVLANLLGNAIKFTTGGHVALEAEVLKTAAGDEVLELRVADTGLGMAEDELPRIFEDFETLDRSFARQQTGAGLGLAIVRRIVDAMEGEIFVESEPGEGTLFTVVLPVTAVNISTPAPREEAPRRLPSLTPRSVLVVEDNDINRAVLRGMLRRRNCKVVEAGDGRTGVAVAGSQRFDLVLMDVAMPGIDGIEAARQIRAGGGPSATTPIVAVTAHAGKAEIAEVLRAGFDSVVTKPVESQRIDDLLEGRGLRTAGGGARLFGVDRTLDIEHLDKLRLELGGERLLGLLSRFAAEASTEVGWMASTEVRQAPPADLADRAHRLAGGAASFGAWRLGERLQRVETAARAGQRSALATHLPGLRSDWAETRQRLAAWQQKARDALAQAS
jgi:CheY-like chemotaxis protein/anti-sigma regulatory factor (Ser/Thr protein kinase)